MALNKFISTQGYKSDGPDKNNPYSIIPSGRITMKDVPHPVYGVDNLGNEQIMYPGQEYIFPGNQVTEIPIGYHRMPDGSIMSDEEHQEMQEGGQAYNDSLSIHKWGESNYKRFQEKPMMENWTSGGFGMPYNIFEAFNRLEELNNSQYDPSETIHGKLNFKDGSSGEAGVNRYPKPMGNKRPYQKPMTHIPSKEITNEYQSLNINTTKREGIPTPPLRSIIGYTQKWDSEQKKWIQEPITQIIPKPSVNYTSGGNIPPQKDYEEVELTDEQIADLRVKGYRVDIL